MSYQIDQACEVRVSGRWVQGTVHEVDADGVPRVRLMGSQKLVRCGPGKVRAVSARVTLRRDPNGGAEGEEELRVIPHAAPAPIVEQPKPRTTRSESHLDRVRELPCCHCNRPPRSHPHHVESGGMALKCSDLLVAPLCDDDHDYYHQHGHLPGLDRIGTMAVLWEAVARALEMRDEERRR